MRLTFPRFAIVTIWALSSLLSVAFAQSTWPQREDIYRIDLVLVEHTNAGAPTRATDAAQDFSRIPELVYVRAPINKNEPPSKSSTWDFLMALQRWEEVALSHNQSPFMGPRLPLQTKDILLNHPIVERRFRFLSPDMQAAVSRLRNSPLHEVRLAVQWDQTLPRNADEIAWRVRTNATLIEALELSKDWFANHAHPPGTDFVDGLIAIKRDQFFRVALDLWWQQTSQNLYGPMRPAFLYPTGAWVAPLISERVIPLGQWVYFDSPRLAVLMRLRPLDQIP